MSFPLAQRVSLFGHRGGAAPAAPGAARRVSGDRYLLFLALVLLGYALDGRGVAYIGLPPVFIGEAALGLGLACLIASRTWPVLANLPQVIALIPLVVWGAARTLPYLGTYGIDALRDAVLWGYCAFALIVAGLILARPERLLMLLRWYRTLALVLVAGFPVVAVLYRAFNASLPRWPWAGVPVIFMKEGDAMVHLAGILAFWVAGWARAISWKWVLLFSLNIGLLGVVDRAGLVAFCAVGALCVWARPRHPMAWRLVGLAVLGIVFLWLTDLRMVIPGGKNREVSFQQVAVNFKSVLGDVGNEGMDSTKEWRLDWWRDIVGYTFRGQYRWTGKGYGVNLAEDDGYQVLEDNSLRSPHNAHMNFLARGGVPGLAAWVLCQAVWAVGVGRAYLRARRTGDAGWEGAFFFLGCYWVAFIINAAFDVFLEGPVGGIWFWTIFGTGIAALWAYRHRPDLLRPRRAGPDEDDVPEGVEVTEPDHVEAPLPPPPRGLTTGA